MKVKTKDMMEEEKLLEQPVIEGSQGDEGTEIADETKHTSEKKFSRKTKKDNSTDRIIELQEALDQKSDQLLRLHAEFDNYRKRTLKEKMELTKSAGESILVNILPVIDDFERALQAMDASGDVGAVKEGVSLIYKRFSDFLKQNGIVEIEAKEKEFDTDLHEALTKIPAPTEDLKGKVVDVIQKGYMLNEKIIRFAKVVIGE